MMESENRPVYEQRFEAAVKVIQSLPTNGSFQPSNEMMLKFYSYYKQATQGPCNIPRPGFWDPVGKVKWDAWNSLGDMPKEEAMTAYVEDLKLILESMPMTVEVEQLLQVLGPFYELVDEKKKISQVSDLTTARLERFARQLEGFGGLNSVPSKSITKSIIRTMQMNGTLDEHAPVKFDATNGTTHDIKDQQDGGDQDDDESGSEQEKFEHAKKGAQKKKSSAGKAKRLSNGGIEHIMAPMLNGAQCSKSAINGSHEDEENEEVIHPVKSHITDDSEDICSARHAISDSDSEVYCDSVDQFGVEEQNSEAGMIMSLEERHDDLSSLGETQERDSEILLRGQEGVQYGGEDGKTNEGGDVQRHSLSMSRAGSSLIRRGRGSRSAGSGLTGSLQGGGGDGERWGSDGARGSDLNEQIVTTLVRLQEDMQSVLERLHTLEALTASQARSLALSSEYLLPPANKAHKKLSWWPFDISPGTVAFALVWPFLVQWLIRLYFQRRRRKLS